jgi:hypothetical protein
VSVHSSGQAPSGSSVSGRALTRYCFLKGGRQRHVQQLPGCYLVQVDACSAHRSGASGWSAP